MPENNRESLNSYDMKIRMHDQIRKRNRKLDQIRERNRKLEKEQKLLSDDDPEETRIVKRHLNWDE